MTGVPTILTDGVASEMGVAMGSAKIKVLA